MDITTNYNLKKPAREDFYDIKDFNDNMDIIDAELKNTNVSNENIALFGEGGGLGTGIPTDAELLGGKPASYFEGLVDNIAGDVSANTSDISLLKSLSMVTVVSTANENLDNYKTQGIYYFSSTYTPINVPTSVNGWLVVIPNNVSSSNPVTKQLWIRHGTINTNNWHTYERIYSPTGGGWSDWTRFATDKDLSEYETLTGGINLLPGEDLNNKYTPAIYICENATIASSLINAPYTGGGFRLTTMRVAGSNFSLYCKQRIDINGSTGVFYERNFLNGTWNPWLTFSGDFPWQDATLTSAFALYDAGSPVKYKRNASMVCIKGIVTPISTITANSSTTIFTLPSVYRPTRATYFVCQGTGMSRWLMNIGTGGSVIIERYGTTTNVDIPSGAWLPFEVSYTIN